jgi:hypothetical protein
MIGKRVDGRETLGGPGRDELRIYRRLEGCCGIGRIFGAQTEAVRQTADKGCGAS